MKSKTIKYSELENNFSVKYHIDVKPELIELLKDLSIMHNKEQTLYAHIAPKELFDKLGYQERLWLWGVLKAVKASKEFKKKINEAVFPTKLFEVH